MRVTLVCLLAFAKIVAQVPNYVPSAGLLAWYPFNGNAADIGPAAHNGTIFGAALTTDRFNVPNAAYSYDGISNYIAVADNASNFRPQNVTVSAWVLFSVLPNYHKMLVAKNLNGVTPFESIDINYAGQLSSWFCNIGAQANNGPYLTPQGAVSTNVWYHVVYQFDDQNNKQLLYINGAFTASSTVNSSIGYDSNVWTFGAEYENSSLTYFLKGKLDDIGIWNRVLSPCEISQLYLASSLQITTSASPFTVCAGQPVTLSAQGAASYTWNPGGLPGQMITVSPLGPVIYTVTGSAGVFCDVTATVELAVSSLPQVQITSTRPVICVGQNIQLIATGAVNYLWNNSATTATISDYPSITTTYTVTGTDANGCSASAVYQQSVSACLGLTESDNTNFAISAFPNPFNEGFSISGVSAYDVKVMNALGQTLVQFNSSDNNEVHVNSTDWPRGIYTVHCIGHNSSWCFKIVKQ